MVLPGLQLQDRIIMWKIIWKSIKCPGTMVSQAFPIWDMKMKKYNKFSKQQLTHPHITVLLISKKRCHYHCHGNFQFPHWYSGLQLEHPVPVPNCSSWPTSTCLSERPWWDTWESGCPKRSLWKWLQSPPWQRARHIIPWFSVVTVK